MKSDSGFSNSKISNGIPNFYNFFLEKWTLSVTIVPSGYIYPEIVLYKVHTLMLSNNKF